ncbi:MAG: hypothetical protein MHMPM18_002866 [Marteilia pararefringens]
MSEVDKSIYSKIKPMIKDLLNGKTEKEITKILACAVCVATGITKPTPISLLDGSKGVKTLMLTIARPSVSQGIFFIKLKDSVDSKLVSSIQNFGITPDKKTFCFDVPSDDADTYLNSFINTDNDNLSLCTVLPKLLPRVPTNSYSDRGSYNRGPPRGNNRNFGNRGGPQGRSKFPNRRPNFANKAKMY